MARKKPTSNDEKPISTSAAAEVLNITPDQFRRLATRLALEPVGEYQNPHYRSGPPCPLWDPAVVRGLVGGQAVTDLLARSEAARKAKKAKPAARQAAFAQRYPNYRDALPRAAEGLFSLNHYAKHRSCRRETKEQIYDLKTGFIQVLCELGLQVEAKIHVHKGQGLRCHACYGFAEDEDEDACWKCDGTGWYRKPELRYVAFRFDVGTSYSWHQPEELVSWPVTLTNETATEWKPEAGEKPVKMSSTKVADAKALLAWVIARYREATWKKELNTPLA